MDLGQIDDVFGTPLSDKSNWPFDKDFNGYGITNQWCSIHSGIYKIREKIKEQRYDPNVVLVLEDRNVYITFAWAPKLLAYTLEGRKETEYILKTGIITGETIEPHLDFKLH